VTAAELLSDLRAEGFALRADAGKLLVQPASRLTVDLRSQIARHKGELLELVGLSLTDRLALAGWQPRWHEPGAHQPTVIAELAGLVWGWDPEEWESAAAVLAMHNRDAMERARKAEHKPAGKGRARTDQPGMF
jgi:hypothetical protein